MKHFVVVPYIGTWIETNIEHQDIQYAKVVPYIGTWIETWSSLLNCFIVDVVPYIGTWIETRYVNHLGRTLSSYLI